MRLPEFITFTGLDARTDMGRVAEISARYPVEWGVLASPKRSGHQPRYPELALLDTFRKAEVRMALHLCGQYAHYALLEPVRDYWEDLLPGFERVQINYVPAHGLESELLTSAQTKLRPGHYEALRFARMQAREVIVQHRTLTYPEDCGLSFLFDKSGGRGAQPAKWPAHPGADRMVGYAGGLAPDNVRASMEAINAAGPYWLDMEGRVRDEEDWLCLDRVERVLTNVYG